MLLSGVRHASLKPVTVWQRSGSVSSPGASEDYKKYSLDPEMKWHLLPHLVTHLCASMPVSVPPYYNYTHCLDATQNSHGWSCEFCENRCPDGKEMPCWGKGFQIHALLDFGEATQWSLLDKRIHQLSWTQKPTCWVCLVSRLPTKPSNQLDTQLYLQCMFSCCSQGEAILCYL